MALQGSGAISFSQIQTEFGGSNPVAMSEYYRNGAYTGANNTSVPTSGAIAMSNFYGATAADVVPDAANWNNIYNVDTLGNGISTGNTNTITVTGINTSVTYSVTITGGYCTGSADNGLDASFEIWAIVNGSSSSFIAATNPSSFSSTTFNITVSNNSTVYFVSQLTVSDAVGGAADGQAGGTITIKNVSNGNTTLDTFTVYNSASNIGG